jgi:hypothetical protein
MNFRKDHIIRLRATLTEVERRRYQRCWQSANSTGLIADADCFDGLLGQLINVGSKGKTRRTGNDLMLVMVRDIDPKFVADFNERVPLSLVRQGLMLRRCAPDPSCRATY